MLVIRDQNYFTATFVEEYSETPYSFLRGSIFHSFLSPQIFSLFFKIISLEFKWRPSPVPGGSSSPTPVPAKVPKLAEARTEQPRDLRVGGVIARGRERRWQRWRAVGGGGGDDDVSRVHKTVPVFVAAAARSAAVVTGHSGLILAAARRFNELRRSISDIATKDIACFALLAFLPTWTKNILRLFRS